MKLEYFGAKQLEEKLKKVCKKIEKELKELNDKLIELKSKPLMMVKDYEVYSINDLEELVSIDVITSDRYYVLEEKLKMITFELDNAIEIKELEFKMIKNILSQVTYTKERYKGD